MIGVVRDEDISRFRDQMRVLQRRLRREVLPAHGLSRTALQVLNAAARLSPDAQPRWLADELTMTSSNVAAALRELEEQGCVHRRKNADDARRVLISITARGSGVVTDLRRERDTWLGSAVEAVLSTAEQQTLLAAGELLQRLAEYQQPASSDARPGSRAVLTS
jgi:DNA-binding MarR family transcriptional regulator